MHGSKKKFTVKAATLEAGVPPFFVMCDVPTSVARLLRSSPGTIELLPDKIIVCILFLLL